MPKKRARDLSVQEAADLLGISASRMYLLYHQGALKAQRIKGMKRLRFRRVDVLRLRTVK